MRVLIAALAVLSTAGPATAQACLGGPRQPGGAAAGVSIGRALEFAATETRVDLVGLSDRGFHATFSAGGSPSTRAVRAEGQVAYAPGSRAVQVCPVATLGRVHAVGPDVIYAGGGLAVGAPIEGPLGAFARADLFRTGTDEVSAGGGRATLGLVAYLDGLDVLLTTFADPERLSETASIAAAVRLSLAPWR